MNSQTSCRNCPLRDSGAFADNSEAEIDFIQQFKKRQTKVATGNPILREGNNGNELYTLLSGWAFRFRMLSDGRRQIFNFLLPGDFVGLQDQLGQASPHSVEALADATLCVFPLKRLWSCIVNTLPWGSTSPDYVLMRS